MREGGGGRWRGVQEKRGGGEEYFRRRDWASRQSSLRVEIHG